MMAKIITANNFQPDKPPPLFSSSICSVRQNRHVFNTPSISAYYYIHSTEII